MPIKQIVLSTLLITALFTTACTKTPELSQKELSEVADFNSSEITALKIKIDNGVNNDSLMFYAPVSMKNCKNYYEGSLSSETKNEKYALFLAAKKALAHAYKTKIAVIDNFSDILKLQKKISDANTPTIFKSRYEDFIEDFMDLIEKVDKDALVEALEEKKTLLASVTDLYGDTIVYKNLHRVDELLKTIEHSKANLDAPLHFEKIVKEYEDAKVTIKKNPDDYETVLKLATKVYNSALFTQLIATNVAALKALSVEEYEDYFDTLHNKIIKLTPDNITYSLLQLSIDAKIAELKSIYADREALLNTKINVLNIKLKKALENIEELKRTITESSSENNTSVDINKTIILQENNITTDLNEANTSIDLNSTQK